VPTYTPKPADITRAWHVVDADGLVLGRVATEVARVLRGKHKPIYAPHVDTGDHVIIVNADKIVLTAGKADKKMVYRHSGYPGGLRSQTYANLLEVKPADAGMHLLGWLPPGVRDRDTAQRAATAGIAVEPLSAFRIESRGRGALLLGYASVPEEQLAEGVRRLRDILQH